MRFFRKGKTGRRIYIYDKKGDSHYDKPLLLLKYAWPDVQATVQYLARMTEAGRIPILLLVGS